MDELKRESEKMPGEEKSEKAEEALAPVVTGKVTVKKKSEGKKLLETFFKGDCTKVRDSVWLDVMLPAARDMLWGMVERAVRGLIYGETDSDRRDRDRGSIRARQVDFTRYSGRDRDRDRDRRRDYDRDSYDSDIYDYGEVRLELRRDAEATLDRMRELVDRYGWVSVAQLYELINERGRYTDRNYGWRDLHDAYIDPVRNGYAIKLPRPRPLD